MSCIIKMTGFNPVRTLVVGDMAHDIEAGKIIGAKTVALTWGYWTRERLEKECSPDYIVDSLPEILLL
jgi:phosphoglycolate phosphatase-like HAD superfamily hydrolase